MRLCTKHERTPASGRWGRDGVRDDGGSVGYWRHGKSLDIFCRIREGGRPVLLAQTLRNAQAVRDAAPAKLAVPRASVRKGHCAPWTPV